MNKVILMGRLVRDPEVKETGAGVAMCSFCVACDRRYQKKGEEKQADFITCVAWRQTAEFVAKHFAKGHRICIEGAIQTRSWTDDKGERRFSTEVAVEHVEFAQDKGAVQERNNAPAPYEQGNMPSGDVGGFMPVEDEELPF